jgi:predicted MPP superfamily phosphohydrolase
MLTRRHLFTKALVACSAGGIGIGTAGAAASDTMGEVAVTQYAIAPAGWPTGLSLRVAAIADVHACEPWMSVERIETIVAATNALKPDLVVLLGDYVVAHRKITAKVPNDAWARALGRLSAPCGVFAVLGNHDWWDDPRAQAGGGVLPAAAAALEQAGIPVLHNAAVRLSHRGQPFTVAGLGDQFAFPPKQGAPAWSAGGTDDLPATLGAASGGGPVILLAHEPDIFPSVPRDVAVTFSGHTHGGQVRIAGFAPVVPSRYGNRYVYGHIVEDGKHLVVSAGLGCSWWPVRFGVPPEIVLAQIGLAQTGPRAAEAGV